MYSSNVIREYRRTVKKRVKASITTYLSIQHAHTFEYTSKLDSIRFDSIRFIELMASNRLRVLFPHLLFGRILTHASTHARTYLPYLRSE